MVTSTIQTGDDAEVSGNTKAQSQNVQYLIYCFNDYTLVIQTFTNRANIFHVQIFDNKFMSFLIIIFVENFFIFPPRACYELYRCMTLLCTDIVKWCLRSKVVYIIVSCQTVEMTSALFITNRWVTLSLKLFCLSTCVVCDVMQLLSAIMPYIKQPITRESSHLLWTKITQNCYHLSYFVS